MARFPRPELAAKLVWYPPTLGTHYAGLELHEPRGGMDAPEFLAGRALAVTQAAIDAVLDGRDVRTVTSLISGVQPRPRHRAPME